MAATAKAKAKVAGAGALGLSCALALSDAGYSVTVCDPGPPLGNASGVAGGMLAPVFEAVLDAEATAHFDLLLGARDLWPGVGGPRRSPGWAGTRPRSRAAPPRRSPPGSPPIAPWGCRACCSPARTGG